jgi:hypothetical protein
VTGIAREFGVMTSIKHDGNPSLLDPEAPRSKEGAWAGPGRKSDPEGSNEQLMYHEVDLCWLCLIGYPVLSSEPWFWTALLRTADFFDGPQVGAKSVIRTNHWLFQLDLSRFCAILGRMFCGFGFYLKISLSAHILLVKSKSGSTFFGGYHPSNQSTDPENTAFLEEICLPTPTTSQFLCYHHYSSLKMAS